MPEYLDASAGCGEVHDNSRHAAGQIVVGVVPATRFLARGQGTGLIL